MASRTPVILVVESEPAARERLGWWLDEAGFETLTCPGPSAPDYTCIAGRGGGCPLTRSADLVLLDLWLGSDRAVMGTRSSELLRYYLSSGKPVVALGHRRDHTRFDLRFLEEPVIWLDGPADRRELVETVAAVLRSPVL